MDNPLIGKFFTFSDPDDGGIHGKSEILSHIYGQFYYVRNFDLCDETPEYTSVLNLKAIRGVPLFSSISAMVKFFNDVPKSEPPLEISH